MSNNICQSDASELLLVEGGDDCHSIVQICMQYKLPEVFGVYDCGGIGKLYDALLSLIASSQRPNILGVVIDSDDGSAEDRWERFRAITNRFGYATPASPKPEGVILPSVKITPSKALPRLGIWIMPNNKDKGMLEDFLLRMADKTCMAKAAECVSLVKEAGIAKFKDAHQSKAILHTYLAWQDEPGKPYGLAIKSKCLVPETSECKLFTTWLQMLFLD